ncbi:hypothetical protein BJV74DRAFT_954556 [Russula compacta]|nr:hypothetical protein BJV74DRAFT_954556 [Russula compacta]
MGTQDMHWQHCHSSGHIIIQVEDATDPPKRYSPSSEPIPTRRVTARSFFYNRSLKASQERWFRNLGCTDGGLYRIASIKQSCAVIRKWNRATTKPSDPGPIQPLLSKLRANSFKEGKIAQRSEAGGGRPRHADRLCGAIRKWEYLYGLHHFHPEFYAMWGVATPRTPTSDPFWSWERHILCALEGMGHRVIVTANESCPRPVVGFDHLNITNDPAMPGVYVDAPGCWMASLRLVPLWANRSREYLILNSLSLTGADNFKPMFQGRVINSTVTPGLAYTYLGDMYLDSKDVETAPLRDFIAYNGWAYGADEVGIYYAMDNVTVYSTCNWWSIPFADQSKRPMPPRNFHWYLLESTPVYLTSGPPVPRVKTILEHAHKHRTPAMAPSEDSDRLERPLLSTTGTS